MTWRIKMNLEQILRFQAAPGLEWDPSSSYKERVKKKAERKGGVDLQLYPEVLHPHVLGEGGGQVQARWLPVHGEQVFDKPVWSSSWPKYWWRSPGWSFWGGGWRTTAVVWTEPWTCASTYARSRFWIFFHNINFMIIIFILQSSFHINPSFACFSPEGLGHTLREHI